MRLFHALAAVVLFAVPARADIIGPCHVYPASTPRVTNFPAGNYRVVGTTLRKEEINQQVYVARKKDGNYELRAGSSTPVTLFRPDGDFLVMRLQQPDKTCVYTLAKWRKGNVLAIYSAYRISIGVMGRPVEKLPSTTNGQDNANFINLLASVANDGDIAFIATPVPRTRR